MEVHFTPEVQAKLDRLVTETGRSADEFVQDAMAGYVDEVADVRGTLDLRVDVAAPRSASDQQALGPQRHDDR